MNYEIVNGRQFLKGSDLDRIVNKPYVVLCTDNDGRQHIFKQIHVENGVVGFASADEAKKAYLNRPNNPTVFLVLENIDKTEGRGPMVPKKCFKEIESAERYIETKPGTFGSPQSRNLNFGVNMLGEIYCRLYHNGYEIKEIEFN
jgi:hypothetical protein